MNLRAIPKRERPRERLEREGSNSLSLIELLAILLSTGTKGKSVLALSEEIVVTFGSLEGVVEASIEELMAIKGVGRAKAIQLKAAFEIALQFSKREAKERPEVSIQEAYHLVREELVLQKQEVLVVILKDVRGKLIGYETVSVGTLSHVLIHPREVFHPAVRRKAASFILAHNHPSGDPTPSKADLELTKQLAHSSRIMGIVLEDHLIVGRSGYVSLKEFGLLF